MKTKVLNKLSDYQVVVEDGNGGWLPYPESEVKDMSGVIGGGGAGADFLVSTKTRPARRKKRAAQIKANKIKPGGNQGNFNNKPK